MHIKQRQPLLSMSTRVVRTLICIITVLLGIASGSGVNTMQAAPRKSEPTATSPAKHSVVKRPHIKDRDAWYQMIHYGRQKPRRGARLKALQQAAALPVTGPTWQPLGPQPIDTSSCPSSITQPYCNNYQLVSGRVTAIAINPADSSGNNVWAGAADGGVWHTTDGGAHWSPALDVSGTESPSLAIGALAISPTNPNLIYVGTGEGNNNLDLVNGVGIYVSTDGGQSFQLEASPQLSNEDTHRIAVDYDPSTPVALLAATNGLWRSVDHLNWTQVIYTEVTDVVFDPTNTNVVYAGVPGTVTRDLSGTLTNSPVLRSTDSGLSWSPVDLGLGTGAIAGRVSLGISGDGTHIYAVIADTSAQPNLLGGMVYSSVNSSQTWAGYVAPSDLVTDSGGHQWLYNSTIAVDPTNPAAVYVGGVDLWYSGNSGQISWSNITNAYSPLGNTYNVHPDNHALAFIPGSETFYEGTDGGVWRGTPTCSSPTACAWNYANLNGGGLNITQFYGGSIGLTGSHAPLYGGAQDNGESYYPSASSTCAQSLKCPTQWTQVYGGDGGYTAVDYTNNANVYEEYIDGDLRVSTDGGASWYKGWTGINICDQDAKNPCWNTPNPDAVNFIMPFVLSPQHSTTLFAGTDRVYQTLGGGTTSMNWTPISPQLEPYVCTSPCKPDNTCSGSTCYRPISALTAAPSNDSTVYAGLNDGMICGTTDAGGVWSCTTPNANSAVTGLAVDPTNASIVYATYGGYQTGSHVYKSTNAGASWSDISAGTTQNSTLPSLPFISVAVSPLNPQQVIAGSDGGIYTTSDGGTNWSHLGTGLPDVEISQIFTDYGGGTLFVATHGRGIWKLPLTTGHVYVYGCGSPCTLYSLNSNDASVAWQDQYLSPCCIVYSNGVLYFQGGSSGIQVYAYDAATGVQLWQSPVLSNSYSTKVAVANGAVYLGIGQIAYAINASTGAVIWSHQIGADLTKAGPPAADTNGVYFSAADGKEYAFSVSTGAQLWSHSINSNKGPAPSPPAAANGLVYVATSGSSSNNVLYALNESTGRPSYSYSLNADQLNDAPVAANGLVYYAATSGWMYAMKPDLSTWTWAFRQGQNGTMGGPAVDGNKLFIIEGGYMYAVDAITGNMLWGPVGNGSLGAGQGYVPSAAGGVVSIASYCSPLLTLAEASGRQVWQWVPPNTAQGSCPGYGNPVASS